MKNPVIKNDLKQTHMLDTNVKKFATIYMFKKLRKDMKFVKLPEIKTVTGKMKNAIDGINIRLDVMLQKTCEPEDSSKPMQNKKP